MSFSKPGEVQVFHSPIGGAWGAITGAMNRAATAVTETVGSGVKMALETAPNIESLWQILSNMPAFDATLIDPLKQLFGELQSADNIHSVEDISAYILERKTNPDFNKKYGPLIQLALGETLGSGITGIVLNQMIKLLKNN